MGRMGIPTQSATQVPSLWDLNVTAQISMTMNVKGQCGGGGGGGDREGRSP